MQLISRASSASSCNSVAIKIANVSLRCSSQVAYPYATAVVLTSQHWLADCVHPKEPRNLSIPLLPTSMTIGQAYLYHKQQHTALHKVLQKARIKVLPAQLSQTQDKMAKLQIKEHCKRVIKMGLPQCALHLQTCPTHQVLLGLAFS